MKYVCLLLSTCSLFCLDRIEQKVEVLVGEIVVLRSNAHYRVAGVVFNKGHRYKDSAEQVLKRQEFNGTALKNYLILNGGCSRPNRTLFREVLDTVSKKKGFLEPGNNELVVHIRVGDVIERCSLDYNDLMKI